jgi:Cu(I)/Ag(I) efflux system membrane protein CusA/SilA
MPALDEGSFLLMPSSMPHAGIEQNRETLRQLDLAVAQIPEVETVVGKSGRTESALDPAPLSMYENIINYKSEFVKNQDGELQKFKVNEDGFFVLKDGSLIYNPNIELSEKQQSYASERLFNKINPTELIPDSSGELYRNWRPEIKTANDIWNEIARVSKIPGVTSAPKLQPIETRLVMLQTGMRAPLGIKVRGSSLEQIEAFGFELEKQLKTIKGVKEQTVFADRMVGKPYLIFDLDRDKIARYGLTISKVQESLQLAVGGVPLTQTIEGRERYNIRLRYPRALRNDPEELSNISIDLPNGTTIPISEVAQIKYERGPGQIKSEDGFLVGYVIFDKEEGFAEGSLAQKVEKELNRMIVDGTLKIPSGISYKLTGSYENQLRAEKTLSIIIPLVLLIISVILYMQFRSIATALFIFSGIAVAFSGGFILIWLYGQDWFLNIDFFGVSHLRKSK